MYIAVLGRFTSMDPVDGGNADAYVYPVDPVNGSDLTGEFSGWDIVTDYFSFQYARILSGEIGGTISYYRGGSYSKGYDRGALAYDIVGGVIALGAGGGEVAARKGVDISIERAASDHSWPNPRGIKGRAWYKHIEINVKVIDRQSGKVVRFIHKQIKYGSGYLLKYGKGRRL